MHVAEKSKALGSVDLAFERAAHRQQGAVECEQKWVERVLIVHEGRDAVRPLDIQPGSCLKVTARYRLVDTESKPLESRDEFI